MSSIASPAVPFYHSGAKSECDVFNAKVESCVNMLVRSTINLKKKGEYEWMFPPFLFLGSMTNNDYWNEVVIVG